MNSSTHTRPNPVLRGALLLLLAVLPAACGGDSGPGEAPAFDHRPAARKLLIVGWDGATYRTVDPLLAQGRLPNLARLVASGSTARLESTVVPISSAAWVGAVTGKTPGENGVYDFFDSVPGSYDVEIVSSRTNRATPLWRTLARNGRKSLVFGVPLTFPPEPMAGAMVCGMLSPFDSIYTSPPGLTHQLRRRGFVPDLGVWRVEQELTQPLIDEQLEIKRAVLVEMLSEQDGWDLGLVVFKSLDVLCHRVYDNTLDGPVAALYEALDRVLGDLLAAAGPDVNVMIVSDHGFNAYYKRFHLYEWLFEAGFAVRSPAGAAAVRQRGGSLTERRIDQHRRQMEELDLSRTRALADTTEGNFGGIRLNVVGREPEGAVKPEEVQDLLDELEAALLALEPAGLGGRLVTRVWRGRDLYPGEFAGKLPDLLFETHPAVVCRSGASPTWYVDASRLVSDHDRIGVLVAAGPDFAARAGRGDARIFDLAPTALHLLGLPTYAEGSGEVLSALLRSPAPPRTIAEADEPGREAWPAPPARQLTPEELEHQAALLRQMGYAGDDDTEGEGGDGRRE